MTAKRATSMASDAPATVTSFGLVSTLPAANATSATPDQASFQLSSTIVRQVAPMRISAGVRARAADPDAAADTPPK